MNDVDFSTIEHLDFNVEERSAPKCQGMFITNENGALDVDRTSCGSDAIVIAVRGCCGQMTHLCKECYNTLATNEVHFHVDRETYGSAWSHPCSFPKFSQIHFL